MGNSSLDMAKVEKEKETIVKCKYCNKQYIYNPQKKFNVEFCSMFCKKMYLIGKRFGRLIIVGLSDKKQGTKIIYSCLCDCGKEVDVTRTNLLAKKIVSCGCYRSEYLSNYNTKKIDFGTRFSRLTVIERSGSNKKGKALYICRCDCGNILQVTGKDLRSGHITSCKCRRRLGNIKHGLYMTEEGRKYIDRIRRETEVKWTTEMDYCLRQMFPNCVVCGSSEALCIDHVVPIGMGGILEPGNVTTLCKSCNSIKSNKHLLKLSIEFSSPIYKSAIKFAENYF